MIVLEDRQGLVRDIEQARAAGARLAPACEVVGIDPRTLQRWQDEGGGVRADRRPEADRPAPAHALSEAGTPRGPVTLNPDRDELAAVWPSPSTDNQSKRWVA